MSNSRCGCGCVRRRDRWRMARSRVQPGTLVEGLFEAGPPSVRAAALRLLVRHRGASFSTGTTSTRRLSQAPSWLVSVSPMALTPVRQASMP